ncbi:conserved hypothetical protein [Theileria orientalis strain Shintoku]|uniref:Uncharacterized protein n=1 Tax=Theileria orientalis strain Shintoku TaxID=869250 RepID=J4CD64_THEOR|nr:conserved hypothetical protein [Theileria orientalis strain Shintoku]BAM40597.1 conserved hypothetical protein [Theileria orientalis strain Shintoku]|eukprot:XP_009690898.1 conserved hypothetical protein [Theileria orientalis strain Shintoku]
MANQCVDMVEAYLDQLREEGCKLIQWSDDLKHQLPPNSVTPPNSGTSPCSKGLTSPAGHQNSLSPFPNPAVGSSSPMQADLSFPGGSNTPAHSVRNFNQFQLNSLDTSQLAKEFPHLSGNGDAHRLLMILYNNYRFVLKKYEELNEQKLSYIEGLREYQYKLDNSNYLIQLQRSQLSSLTNLAPTYSDLASNSGAVAAGWLNKEHNLLNRERELLRLKEEDLKSREEELSSKEQDLRSKEEDLTSRESNLASREEALAAKQLEVSGKEHELFSMQDSLSSMEQELTSKRESLAERESNLAAKEAELFQREALLSKNEGLLSEGQELLKSRHDPLIASDLPQGNKPSYVPGRDKSIFVEERGQVAFTASRPNANHGHTDISNANSGQTDISNANSSNTHTTDKGNLPYTAYLMLTIDNGLVGVQSTAAAAANTLEDEE